MMAGKFELFKDARRVPVPQGSQHGDHRQQRGLQVKGFRAGFAGARLAVTSVCIPPQPVVRPAAVWPCTGGRGGPGGPGFWIDFCSARHGTKKFCTVHPEYSVGVLGLPGAITSE